MDIAVIGSGRMGRGIAQSYAFAGRSVLLIDLKDRSDADRERLAADARGEIGGDLRFLASIGVGAVDAVEAAVDRIAIVGRAEAEAVLPACPILYEAVPETETAKRDAFAWACRHARTDAVMASTSSTMAVDDLAAMGTRPERFVNAHWLNPAMLMPLVEVARGPSSGKAAVDALVASLEAIGKRPVVMKGAPGYIVPRLQALAMNEAARIAEEGIAPVEEIDRAVRLGFGIRYAVLGLLEFIDFGGGDTLFHASDYLSRTIDPERFAAPRSVRENMAAGRNGMRDGQGFYDWSATDVSDYRTRRMEGFVALLRFLDLLPSSNVLGVGA